MYINLNRKKRKEIKKERKKNTLPATLHGANGVMPENPPVET